MAKAGIYRRLAGGLAVAALAAFGCQQSNKTQGTPGALPGTAMGSEATPRLNATTYFAHAHLLERQGDFDRARAQYEKALAVMPEFTSARNRLGITLNKLNKNSEATRHFRAILAKHPELVHVHNNLGFSLYLEGKYAEAEGALRQALQRNEGFSRARMNLAIVLAKLGRFDEALAEFQKVGGEADAHYNVAMLQVEAGKYAEAAQNLEIALRANPKLEAARLQLHEVSRLAALQPVTPAAPVTLTAAQSPASPGETGGILIQDVPAVQPSDPANDQPAPNPAPATTDPGEPAVVPAAPAQPGTSPTPVEPGEPGSDEPAIIEPTDPKPEPEQPGGPGRAAAGALLGQALAAAGDLGGGECDASRKLVSRTAALRGAIAMR